MNKTDRWRRIVPVFAVLLFLFFIAMPAGQARAAEPIKVGVLHSLSGTMSISEVAVKDGTLMAIAEINAKGGSSRQADRAHYRGRRIRLADIRGKGEES